MTAVPRLVLAGLSGGAGKTIISLGLVRSLVQDGLIVAPFKKGPDYIDSAWLGLAARRPATNLDPYLMPAPVLADLFAQRAHDADLAFIEGNRGLFDGGDARGTFSTSQLARELAAPVVLALDATKMTRTAAAIVAGCAAFEPGLNLAGVILNRTAGERHRSILRRSIERYTDVAVLGALPKLRDNPIPERHMGLVPDRETAETERVLDDLADLLRASCDLDRLRQIAASAPVLARIETNPWPETEPCGPVRIGYVLDAALWFYYQENLEALRRAGAELVPLSLLDTAAWPDIHGLYLGGGFPETHARALAGNRGVLDHMAGLSRRGLPVYAECGGFMVLCAELHVGGDIHRLAGVFPVATTLCARPQGLGYSEARVTAENPFHPLGAALKGHEFHYSMCLAQGHLLEGGQPPTFALTMTRGTGMVGGRDGILADNTFAAYTHIHALGTPHWAPAFVRAAARWRDGGR